jgi:hypothetical protein
MMPIMFFAKFVKAPVLAGVPSEVCEQFVGLTVQLCRLERVGLLQTHESDGGLILSPDHQLHPRYAVMIMEKLLHAAHEQGRQALCEYLKSSRIEKLLVERTLVENI